MLAKTTTRGGAEWDEQLPYVLFAYRASRQASTLESPFYLLYGRDSRLPVPEALSPRKNRVTMNLKEYGIELHAKLSAAWELARKSVQRAQKKQKEQYDRRVTPISPFREGERVFLYKPGEKTGEARKLARPFHGPYRVREMGTNTASIVRVDRPEEEPMLVSVDRLRRCPRELGDEFWPPDKGGQWQRKTAAPVSVLSALDEEEETGASDNPEVMRHANNGREVATQLDTELVSENRDPGDDTIPPLEEDSLPSQPLTTEIPNHPILQETREAEASELNESTVRSGPMVKGKWAGRLRPRKSRSHARAKKDGRKVKTRKTRVASLRDANLSAPRSVCQGQNSSEGN